jgi:hypothetical protein
MDIKICRIPPLDTSVHTLKGGKVLSDHKIDTFEYSYQTNLGSLVLHLKWK